MSSTRGFEHRRTSPVLLFSLLAVASIASCSQPKPKDLHSDLRPYQAGSRIDLSDNPGDSSPRRACSYGFHAQKNGHVGLVTAVHCTNAGLDSSGHFYVFGERIWQSFDYDATVIATVSEKPDLLDKDTSETCRTAIEDLGRYDLRWCLVADAAFAPFSSTVDYVAGAVANVPLSVAETKIGPVDEKKYHSYTGYGFQPLEDQPLYKIGATTGKTEGYLVSGIPVDLPVVLSPGAEEVVLLDLYSAQSYNSATFADHGDSGGPIFHSYVGDSEGPFVLEGIVSAGTDYGLLFIEPLGDILDALGVEVEHAGEGGGLGLPDGS